MAMLNAILLMDLHWGAIPPERMHKEIEETLYKHIESLNKLDMIVIGGDLFDCKQYLSSDVTNYVIKFINELLELTHSMGTYIYIVKGTRTHDDLQLQTLRTIFNSDRNNSNVIIIDEVTEMSLLHIGDTSYTTKNGHPLSIWVPTYKGYEDCIEPDDKLINILFIPEEYIIDQNEYYKNTLYSKNYDFIFGHGMIDKIWYADGDNTSVDKTKHCASPVFKVKDLTNSGKHVYFGHIHIHKKYGNFEYVGPYTRWEFGKDDPVGYVYIEYDSDTKELYEEFVENKLAQKLTTRILNIQEDISLTELNDKIDTIISETMTYSEKIRLIANLNSKLPTFQSIRDYLVSKIGNIKFVKLILSIDIPSETIEESKTTIDEQNNKKKYLYGSNMNLEKQIREFLKEKRGIDISSEDIKNILDSCE